MESSEDAKTGTGSQTRVHQSTEGDCSPTINTSGNVTVIYNLNEEETKGGLRRREKPNELKAAKEEQVRSCDNEEQDSRGVNEAVGGRQVESAEKSLGASIKEMGTGIFISTIFSILIGYGIAIGDEYARGFWQFVLFSILGIVTCFITASYYIFIVERLVDDKRVKDTRLIAFLILSGIIGACYFVFQFANDDWLIIFFIALGGMLGSIAAFLCVFLCSAFVVILSIIGKMLVKTGINDSIVLIYSFF